MKIKVVFMRTHPLLGALLLLSTTVAFAGSQVDETPGSRERPTLVKNGDADKAIREAVRIGHIVPGMDRGQVTAALGEPIRKVRSPKTLGLEHWLYRMEKLHQEQFRGRGWSFVRITFRDGRVVAIDPR
jgi:hypothetical protein